MHHRLLRICAVFMTLLFIPVELFAAQEGTFPAPPQLYSQAAVLIDANTGTILAQKNAFDQMYPASITKLMTLLLAMEEGNPADVVTMTDEAVWSVPRVTTHIALTPGEEITFEQLEYAMMVESANDAANGIAVHLGGSLAAFAQKMNRRAAELGATRTHFSNANGLPEPDHYTCAYDMALITRAALALPQFRELAGCKRYEIPPTNLQEEARVLNNRQYMFAGSDTYEGAFAGKTGWTEDSGKTLVTLAERDGMTLISVVMKPKGTVDGEFKDSTALLDYGFDNFYSSSVPIERIPARDAPGGRWVSEETVQVVLPRQLTVDELSFAVDGAGKLRITAPQEALGFPAEGVDVQLRFVANPPPVLPATADPPAPDPLTRAGKIALVALKWAGIGLVAAFLLLLLVRQVLRARYLLRRRRAEVSRKREAALREEARRRVLLRRANERRMREKVVDVTVDKQHKHKITVIDERDL